MPGRVHAGVLDSSKRELADYLLSNVSLSFISPHEPHSRFLCVASGMTASRDDWLSLMSKIDFYSSVP
jgi:hypothetical protein